MDTSDAPIKTPIVNDTETLSNFGHRVRLPNKKPRSVERPPGLFRLGLRARAEGNVRSLRRGKGLPRRVGSWDLKPPTRMRHNTK